MRGIPLQDLRRFLRLPAQLALLLPLLLAATDPHAEPGAAPGLAPASSPVAANAPPIAVPDVLTRADEDQLRVDGTQRLLEAVDPAGRLSQELDEIAHPVDAKLYTSAGGGLRKLPIMRLESLARHWAFDARRFERWEAQARRMLAPYSQSALQLAQRRAAWSTTRAAGLLDGLPPAMSARVDSMIAQIDVSEAALGATLARQFDLMRRASELKVRIQAGRSDVDAAIDDFDRRLFKADVPPLWQQLSSGIRGADALAVMHQGIEIEQRFAQDYRAADGSNQQVLHVMEILLLPLLVWLVMRSRRGQADEPPNHRVRALRRPVSSWLLLSMLGALVLEPDAPLLVQEIALLLALVPVLRLMPAGTVRALGIWPYIAAALYILDRLGLAAVIDGSIYRLYLLALSSLALLLTVRLLRRAPQGERADDRHLLQAVRLLAWIALALLVIAVAANISGNVSLAETLTSGVIDSGYMALLLYAGVAACRGILYALQRQPELAQRRLFRQHGSMLDLFCTRLLVLGAMLGWLLYSMDRFRVLRPLRAAGATVLDLGIDVGEVSIHLGDVLVFVFSVWLALWAARGVRRLLRDELHGHTGLPRGVGNSIASLSYYAVLLLGLLVALSAAGFKVSQLALVFGALGVGIGFGLQNVVNNFVSGLVLMFERPIQPGDVIDAAGSSGTVREIGLRATILRTFDGADVVVPNGLLLSGNLTNWTLFDRSRRIDMPVSVAYSADPAQVLAVLGAAVQGVPGVAEQPAPVVLMTGYGDSGLNFIVRVWTPDSGTWLDLRGELLARILAALRQANIGIPYPQMDLHLRSMPEAARDDAGGVQARAGGLG